MWKIMYLVATLTTNQTIYSAGGWETWEQCEAARMAAEALPGKTIIAINSTCVRGGVLSGAGGGGGYTGGASSPARSVSP